MTRRLIVLAVLLLSLPRYGAAQSTVFLVRHAERADTAAGGAPPMTRSGGPPADPDLSDAGRARAESLAAVLKDANISAIYTTELRRTQQTAAPLAHALGLKVIVIPASGQAALVAKLNALTGNALVVGHSNTVPEVIKGIGVSTPVRIEDSEYDSLFIVVRQKTPAFLRLHYR